MVAAMINLRAEWEIRGPLSSLRSLEGEQMTAPNMEQIALESKCVASRILKQCRSVY